LPFRWGKNTAKLLREEEGEIIARRWAALFGLDNGPKSAASLEKKEKGKKPDHLSWTFSNHTDEKKEGEK